LSDTRNSALKSDFLHYLFINEGDLRKPPAGVGTDAQSFGPFLNPDFTWDRTFAGSVQATKDTTTLFNDTDFPKRVELYACIIAHELTHLLINRRGDQEFNMDEHTLDPDKSDPPNGPKDWTCLMYGGGPGGSGSSRSNREFATVNFYPIVQGEIATRTSDTFGQ
jgi:hypothetical protein